MYLGYAIEARIATIAQAIISSSSVNPRERTWIFRSQLT